MDLKEAADILHGELNRTQGGAERIIVQLKECKASVVFVPHSNQWKLFRPFPAAQQERIYFSTFEELSKYVNNNR